GIVTNIFIKISSVDSFRWIAACPAPQPWRVIPRSVGGKSRLLIALLAGVSVPLGRLGLAAHRLIGRAPIGKVLFIGNDLRLIVQLQGRRAEVIAELIADELLRRGRIG